MSSPEAIAKLFAEALDLYQRWRKTKAGKKAIGGAELDTSLITGSELVSGKQSMLFKQYGMEFEKGDPISRLEFAKIYTDMDNRIVGILRVVLSGGKVTISPLDMYAVSKTASDQAIRAMADLSRRLENHLRKAKNYAASEDSLPQHPEPPRKPVQRRRSYERRSPQPAPGAPPPIPPKIENQIALRPKPGTDADAASRPFGRGPSMEALPLNSMERLQNILSRKGSSASTLSSDSSVDSRQAVVPYQPPESLIPAIEVSYTIREESCSVIREGRESVDRLWAMANIPLRPSSAPLIQGEWPRSGSSLSLEQPRSLNHRASASNFSLNFSATELHKEAPVFQNLGTQARKGPVLSFSAPPARFRRNASQP